MFTAIECIKGTFSLKVKEDAKPYMVPLGIDGTAVSCNSSNIVLKPNGTVQLCLDPARLRQALIWPIHMRLASNHRLPKLTNSCYITIIDVSSSYHNLNLIKNPLFSYLTTFACQFSSYRFTRLPFETAPAGDMVPDKNQ